ncbi:MAG TPA: nuclear transport factor 2 family protein [Acidimicrobiia bacterium]|nr:nuclear transport factor 2 family protein [Acidimicrobiia bacterium]
MDAARFSEWFDRYGEAWRTYDRDAIGDLFTNDAVYTANPFAEPVVGRQAIVEDWRETFDEDPDEQFEFKHEVVAVDGDLGVVQGWITYTAGSNTDDWRNLFIIRLEDDGRCREYLEWYFRRPRN